MSGLLLGTAALRRFIAADATLHDWLDRRPADTLHLSVVSIGEVLAQAEAKPDVSQRRLWSERLTTEIPADFGPRLHSFDLGAAKQWSALRASLREVTDPIVESDLSVIAIVLDQQLDYVAPREAWQSRISGLRQHDPWTPTPSPT